MTRVVSWNIAKRHEPWRELVGMDADVALLQEAGQVPEDVADQVEIASADRPDDLYDRWPMVVKLSDRIEVEWFRPVGLMQEPAELEIPVSDVSTVAAARVIPRDADPFIVVSMYARWIIPHSSTGTTWGVGYSDGSAHRIVSDLSAFAGSSNPSTHRILAAGDLNMIYGAADNNRLSLPARERTVFDRMAALGLEFLGPQFPNGRRASPTPQGLPGDTKNVPTYYTSRRSPETAENQLDYAFASRGFHESVTVRAMNEPGQWGSSDHCRLWIEVSAG